MSPLTQGLNYRLACDHAVSQHKEIRHILHMWSKFCYICILNGEIVIIKCAFFVSAGQSVVCLQLIAKGWQFCAPWKDLLHLCAHSVWTCIWHDVWDRWVNDSVHTMQIGKFQYLHNLHNDSGVTFSWCYYIFGGQCTLVHSAAYC